MRSPAQAIVWEICAKNRGALGFAFGLIPFCALLSLIAGPNHELVKMLHVFCVIATFSSLIWVCSYTANDSRGRFSGFPSWMYTLPLRTSALVLFPMLLGFVLTCVAVVAWEFTISKYWGAPFELKYLGWHTLLLVGTLFSFQALVWSLHRFRWIRIVAMVAVMFVFFYVGLVGHVFKFSNGAVFWFAGVALAIPLAVAGAIAGVERDRRERWQGWTGRLLEYVLDLIPRRSGAFTSAARAQLWIEWRRKGLFMGAVFGVPMALSMFLFPLGAALYLDPVATLFHFSYPFLLMIIFSGVIGGTLAKFDAWSPDLGIHPMVASRPLRTSALLFAKMKTAARVACLGWVLFSILLVPVITMRSYSDWDNEQVQHFWQHFPANFPKFWHWLLNPIVILALVVATWHTMIQSMSIALTGNKRRIAMNAWQGMIVLAAVIGIALWLYRNPSWFDPFLRFLPWFTLTMMGLKVFGTVRAFAAAKALVSHR
ncbi:MAG TPA: hypothetical protein VGF13_11235, partial [Verrucomicrobiae bacterium]